MNCFSKLAAAAIAVIAGCAPAGPPMGTVAGKLTIGGQPSKDQIRVTFINSSVGQGAGATVGVDGSYKLETALPTVEYKIFVSKVLLDTAAVSTAKEILLTVEKAYRSEETTPLKFAVKEGANVFDVDIPAAGGK